MSISDERRTVSFGICPYSYSTIVFVAFMHVPSFLRSIIVKDHHLLPLVAWCGPHHHTIITLFDPKMNQEEELT